MKGHRFNHKRVYRVYCHMGLNLRRKSKRVLPKRIAKPLEVVNEANRQWALDFVHDSLYCGRRYRALNIIDEGTRESLAIEANTSLSAVLVLRIMERLKAERGLPCQIRVDNGPELLSGKFTDWCKANEIQIVYIPPGKPQKTGLLSALTGHFAENSWMPICLRALTRF